MKKALLITLLCLFACLAKAQTDSALDKELSVPSDPKTAAAITNYDGQIFSAVEEEPTFPGDFKEFVKQNLKAGNYKKGAVYIQFVVEVNGTVDGIHITRSLGETEDLEAIRLIQKSQNWNPGKQHGKAVRCHYTEIIQFD